MWEYNAYIQGFEYANKQHYIDSVMTGYYSGYYNNAGNKAKKPEELIKKYYLSARASRRGAVDIEQAKEIERRNKT